MTIELRVLDLGLSKFELGLSYRFFVQTLCMNVNDGKDYRRYTYQVRKFNTTFSFFKFYKRERVPTAAPLSLTPPPPPHASESRLLEPGRAVLHKTTLAITDVRTCTRNLLK